MKEKYQVSGMSCSACQAKIEKDLSKLNGIDSVQVSLLNNNMIIDYDDTQVNSDQIIKTVKKSGYSAKLAEKKSKIKDDTQLQDEVTFIKKRLIISLIFLIPLLYVSMGSMLNFPLPLFLKDMNYTLHFALVQLILVMPIMFLNRKFFINGINALLKRAPNMDSLIAIGSGAAFIYGIYMLFQIATGFSQGDQTLIMAGRENLYFEASGAILTFVTIGKYLEEKSKKRTTNALRKLMNLTPKTSIVERDGKTVEIPSDQIVFGDIVVARPGSVIPVDGEVIAGTSDVDESLITGEALPIFKQQGDMVISATINKTGSLRFRATNVGSETTIAKIIKIVEETTSKKIPIQKLADKISGIFVPIVIGISIISFVLWLILGSSFAFALSIAIAVLVISCPCALGLATPVAIMVSTGKGAEEGILLKSPETLEIAHKVTTIVFDKTGTLTSGMPEVTDTILLSEIETDKLVGIAATLEQYSEHPLAKAIVAYANELGIPMRNNTEFEAIPGQGIKAKLDNSFYYAGNLNFIKQFVNVSEKTISIQNEIASQGKTPIFISSETVLLGLIAFRDKLKPDSRQAIELLKKSHFEVIMLTGDHYLNALVMQKELNIDKILSEVKPSEKGEAIAKLQAEGKIVAMVGDGINDAIALMQADVGIAIGAGTDIAIESADIVLMHNSLLDVVKAITLSKKTMRIIKQNLFWAFIYNIVGIPLAAGVFYISLGLKLSPIVASLAMSFSSVSVVLNALRLKLIKINGGKIK